MLRPTPQDAIVELDALCLSKTGKPYTVPIAGYSLTRRMLREGAPQTELAGITFTSADGFAVTLPEEILANREVFVVLRRKGKALELPAIAVPGERAVYWTKDVVEMRCRRKSQAARPWRVTVFQAVLPTLTPQRLRYKKAEVTAYALREVCEKLMLALPCGDVQLVGWDGYGKSELAETALAGAVTLEGDSAPLYFGETLARGMRVKGLMALVYGEDCVYFARQPQTLDALFAAIAMEEAEGYRAIGAGGDVLAIDCPQAATLRPTPVGVALEYRGDVLQPLHRIEVQP